jgi:hypothetical protein
VNVTEALENVARLAHDYQTRGNVSVVSLFADSGCREHADAREQGGHLAELRPQSSLRRAVTLSTMCVPIVPPAEPFPAVVVAASTRFIAVRRGPVAARMRKGVRSVRG